jgi:hypothetical protein
MSQIGPNLASSIVGGIAGQQQAGEARRAAEGNSVERSTFSKQLTEEINSDDLDNQIDAEAEGRGGQGRSFSETESQTSDEVESSDDDDQPIAGLDLTA